MKDPQTIHDATHTIDQLVRDLRAEIRSLRLVTDVLRDELSQTQARVQMLEGSVRR